MPHLHLDALTSHSWQAMVDGDDTVFVLRETCDGWKTEGHPGFDGLLCDTRDELIAHIEGRN